MNYIFYERTDSGTNEVARLQSGRFTGVKAKMVQKILEQADYPNKAPTRILHGIRLWAEENKDDTR